MLKDSASMLFVGLENLIVERESDLAQCLGRCGKLEGNPGRYNASNKTQEPGA